jgi:macrolide-specific efflux system membrane fusion protein
MNPISLLCLAALLAAETGEPIEIPAAAIKVLDEVAVPASEAGVLARVTAKEGQLVAAGAPLAQILAADVRLAVERAKLEAEIARKKMNNDVNAQFAKKSVEVARAEYRRSQETNEKYPKTVSDSELDRQKLLVEKGQLEVKQAEHEQEIAALERSIRENEQRTAEEQLARRTIAAPLAGMVVEVHHRAGEWVQPGETVARIIRLDRLRAEGFLAAKYARRDLVGSQVKLHVVAPNGDKFTCSGEIVFVSPEIDSLNSQVRVWAEVENDSLQLLPGMTARLTVNPK